MTDKKTQINVEVDEQIAQGIYTNLAMVAHSQAEFTMDFIYVQPQAPKAKVRSRVIASPVNVKRFLQILKEALANYEKNYGVIELGQDSDRKIGF